MKKIITLLLLSLALIFAGCQEAQEVTQEIEEEQTQNEQIIEQAVRVIEVEGFGREFNPSLIEVQQGETVEFVFTNTRGTHDFVIPELGVGTEIISEGETDSFTVTFDEAGTFEFLCSVGNHAAEGMVGEIIVS
ncbi:MAG: cupredoxin domain-containing protein [Candidatus Woesearchaeota archaeon]